MIDLISRQDAIDAIERNKCNVERPITESRWFDFGLLKAQEVLRDLPSAEPEWELFRLITSVWYGKECYYLQDNGHVYSRITHRYMHKGEAIDEFLGVIGYNE